MKPGPRDQRGNVPVTFGRARNQSNRMAIDVQLRADNRIDSGAFCFQAESNDAANVGVVGYANAMVSEVRRFSNECFGGDGSVAEGESSVGTELDGHSLL